jgi:hypothetical protein
MAEEIKAAARRSRSMADDRGEHHGKEEEGRQVRVMPIPGHADRRRVPADHMPP